jgi:PAS domain S-box-containing protein
MDDDDLVLRRILEGTARHTGEAFFAALVRNLALAVDCAYAFVAEFSGAPTRVRTLAVWGRGAPLENFEYELAGTPCEEVVRGSLCHHPQGVQGAFPADALLVEMGADSYLGVPLQGTSGAVLGHLAVLDTRPMSQEPRRLAIFRIFAERAAAELERLRMEERLRESERQFRDLYEEAPIAYVYEDLETRFVSANRAAMRLLGLRPEEVAGTVGRTLLAPTEETRARVDDAFAEIQQGREKGALELELRRKDDGRPIWVQFWSRPEPDGRHTRTMLVDITDRVLAERERNRLHQQNLYLQEEIKTEYNFEEIVGRSQALRGVLDQVRQVADTDATVLILGETGTGKELIARAIHAHSRRRGRALIKLNCAALPPSLVESELFGHEKGAFTGATEKRIGRFALADGGTIFLDEIGDVPLDVQVRLLRVLQEQEFEAIGSSRTVKVDVRVIAATNRDLPRAIAEGSFRSDLFYRLDVFPIRVPPLRERADDVRLLTHYFVEKYAARLGRTVERIPEETMRRLLAYSWPGNVRELENVLERAVILMRDGTLEIDPAALAPAPAPPTPAPPAPAAAAPAPAAGETLTAEEAQRRHITETLLRTGWVVEGERGAAKLLGVHPNTLRSRMQRLGIRRSREPS